MKAPATSLVSFCKPKQWKTLSKEEMIGTKHQVFGANGPIGHVNTFTHSDETILIGCRGSCGSVHVMPPYSYANGNAMALGDLDNNRVDLRYLFRYLQQRGFSDVTTGSSQPQIIQSNLRRVQVPLPPLNEQRRIAVILDKADALRRKRIRALDLGMRLTRSIFEDMFDIGSASCSSTKTVEEIAEFVTDREHQTPRRSSSGIKLLSARNIQMGYISGIPSFHESATSFWIALDRCMTSAKRCMRGRRRTSGMLGMRS